MRGIKIIERAGWMSKKVRLTHQKDGCCIFQAGTLCRIHKKFGYDAKPHICQLAPLQMVPHGKFTYVTLRRYCPSAAADDGLTVEEQLPAFRVIVQRNDAEPKSPPPPLLTRRIRRSWPDLLIATDALERFLLDDRYPLIRRLAHGIEFCNLLDRCNFRSFDRGRLIELVSLLEKSAVEKAGAWFQKRQPPRKSTQRLFLQTLMESLRLHPTFPPEDSWRERWRLIHTAIAFHRGRGPIPSLRLPFPAMTFESLEEPLGPLPEDVLTPLTRYFESAVVSLRYAMFKARIWSVTDGFRALALTHPVAMWTLRYACGMKTPTHQDAIQVIMMLDRCETHAALVGSRHRLRVRALSNNYQLLPLLAWYGR
jgi:hypothetical protein